jgi:hypothetical protein
MRKAFNNVNDFIVAQRARLAEAATRNGNRNVGWSHRFSGYNLGRLPSGMADLHPEMSASSRSCISHSLECLQLATSLHPIDDNVARTLEVASVDLNIAGQQETRSTFGPAPIQGDMTPCRPVLRVGHALRHSGFAETVFYRGPAGQNQFMGGQRFDDGLLG